MRLVLSAIWIAFFALLGQARAASADTALSAAIDGAWREPESRARDAYRHPYELLVMFWGLKPGMTVVEVDPGARGWWTVFAPYARATGGAYIAALPDRAQSGAAAEVPIPRTPPFAGRRGQVRLRRGQSVRLRPTASRLDSCRIGRPRSGRARLPQLGAPRRRDPNLSARLFHDVEAGRHSRRRTAPCAPGCGPARRNRLCPGILSHRGGAQGGVRPRGKVRDQRPTQKTPKTILSAFGRCPRLVAARQLGSPLTRTLTTQNTMRSAGSDL